LDVRFPLPLGSYHRMANVVPKGWGFAAYFAFGHDCISPAQIEPASATAGRDDLSVALWYHKPGIRANRARSGAHASANRVG
jgi:hypothetical protein